MKAGLFGKIIAILAGLAVALTVFLAALVVRQEDARRRAGLDAEAFQILAGIMDLWNENGGFDPSLWRGVTGFGVYGSGGAAVFCWGSAPPTLTLSRFSAPSGDTILQGNTLRITRRAGTAPGFRGIENRRGMMGNGGMMGGGMMGLPADPPAQGSGANPPSPGANGPALNGPPVNGAGRLVYLELDVADRLRERNPLLWIVTALLVLFVALVALVIIFSRRLTAYRERERETAHLVQLGEAARTLAHEIKNPLGVIRVQCATLRRTLGEDRLKNVTVIEEETARLALLTDRVRDFLHASPGRPESRAAVSYLEQCRGRWGDRLAVADPDAAAAGVLVSMDPARLVQVLDNLVANALEASPAEAPVPELTLSLKRGRALFAVADRGSGVSEENRPQLFRPFFTTKAKGSGIGLALGRRFAEQAGGTLSWAERPGGGSLFTLSLPAENGGKEDAP